MHHVYYHQSRNPCQYEPRRHVAPKQSYVGCVSSAATCVVSILGEAPSSSTPTMAWKGRSTPDAFEVVDTMQQPLKLQRNLRSACPSMNQVASQTVKVLSTRPRIGGLCRPASLARCPLSQPASGTPVRRALVVLAGMKVALPDGTPLLRLVRRASLPSRLLSPPGLLGRHRWRRQRTFTPRG